MGVNELNNALLLNSQKLLTEIELQKDIFILSNSTVDGIISSAIIFISIFDNNGSCTIRSCSNDIRETIKEAIDEKHDFYIFTDFDSNIFEFIKELLKENNFLFINTDLTTDRKKVEKADNFINPFIYNIDSKDQINVSGLSYLLVKNYCRDIIHNSYLPIISAISKEQDDRKDRQLTGLNKEILQSAVNLNLIEERKMLTFGEIGSSSIINVLENNVMHFIKELTWNREACIKVIKDAHATFINDGKIRSFNEFDENESLKILDSIEKLLCENLNSLKKKDIKNTLFGYNYILVKEEIDSYLQNARSFANALNCCINSNNSGLALSVCLGDRSSVLTEIAGQVHNYNNQIKKLSTQLFGEKWRYHNDKETMFINGEGILNEGNIYLFIEFLEKSISFSDRLICLRTLANENEEFYKITIIKTKFCDINFNIIEDKINQYMNNRNNQQIKHIDDNKIEIKIPIVDLEDFLSNIKKIIIDARAS